MEWHDVWVPNETSLRVLNQYILDPAILLENCPLDYGRHTPDARLGTLHMPIGNLGHISKLPLELQHHVLLSLDVQTLYGYGCSERVTGVAEGNISSTHDLKTLIILS